MQDRRPPDGPAGIPILSLTKLPRSFYLRPTLRVANDLLGKYLVRASGRNALIARIVEVEAYLGEKDPASHAYRGKTKRNEVMFREGGFLYVYFTYGMHYCCNVVTESEGRARAVLIRAGEPVAGIGMMIRNRGLRPHVTGGSPASIASGCRPSLLRQLCSGPARLCQALGIARKENGTDLLGDTIWLGAHTRRSAAPGVARSSRIGINHGKEHLWRFYVRGNPFVSRSKPRP